MNGSTVYYGVQLTQSLEIGLLPFTFAALAPGMEVFAQVKSAALIA